MVDIMQLHRQVYLSLPRLENQRIPARCLVWSFSKCGYQHFNPRRACKKSESSTSCMDIIFHNHKSTTVTFVYQIGFLDQVCSFPESSRRCSASLRNNLVSCFCPLRYTIHERVFMFNFLSLFLSLPLRKIKESNVKRSGNYKQLSIEQNQKSICTSHSLPNVWNQTAQAVRCQMLLFQSPLQVQPFLQHEWSDVWIIHDAIKDKAI